MSHKRQALELHDYGFWVVPIPTGQKNPVLPAWGKQRIDRERLADHFEDHPDDNIGVVEGPAANLVEIDCDGAGWEQALDAYGLSPDETFSVNGKRGPKLFFRWDERFSPLRGKIVVGPLEIRLAHTGQYQSCVFGAVDYGGDGDVSRTYILRPVATLSDEVVEKILSLAPARTEDAKPVDDWFDDLDKPSMSKVFAAVAALKPCRADDYDTWFKIGCALKACGPEYFSLFDSFSRLSKKYGKSKETWDAIKSGKITIGTLFHFAKLDGWQDVQQPAQEPEPEKPDTFSIIPAWQLATGNYDLNYLIDDVLVEHQPMLVGGASKSLKTSIILDLAIALASKTNFLGVHPVKETRRSLVMSGESGVATLQETAHRICWAHAVELYDLDLLSFSEELPQCDDQQSLAKLARTLAQHETQIFVVDPAYLALGDGADAANVFAQGRLLRAVNDICKPLGVTLILCHHAIKSAAKSGQPLHLEDLAMSGFSEFARQWLLLNRREPFRPNQPHRLWITIGGSAGHQSESHLDIDEGDRHDEGGRVWRPTLKSSDEVFKDGEAAKDSEALCLVIQILQLVPEGLTLNAIHEKTKIDRRRLQRLLPNDYVIAAEIPHHASKTKTRPGFKMKGKVAA